MRRSLLASALLVAGLAGALFAQLRSSGDVPATGPDPAPGGSGTARERTASLFCEFTNMADQAPRVGFYFRAVPERASPTFALVFRREQDGSQGSCPRAWCSWVWSTTMTGRAGLIRLPGLAG